VYILLGRHPHSRSHGRCRQGRSIAVLADKADEQSTGRERERSATQRAKHGAFYNQQRERQSILTKFLRGSCRSTRQTKRPPSHPDGRSIAQFEPLYPQSPTQSARGRFALVAHDGREEQDERRPANRRANRLLSQTRALVLCSLSERRPEPRRIGLRRLKRVDPRA
jgi:hypothetical protein